MWILFVKDKQLIDGCLGYNIISCNKKKKKTYLVDCFEHDLEEDLHKMLDYYKILLFCSVHMPRNWEAVPWEKIAYIILIDFS